MILVKSWLFLPKRSNSINEQGLNRQNILERIYIVASGVVELVEKQKQGFTYIKP